MFYSDVLQSRLDFATKLGADATILVSRDSNEADLVKQIHSLLGTHPDVSFDASGVQSTVRLSMLVSDIELKQYLLSLQT